MQSVRHASIPVDHLLAELAAYPLASQRGFELGLTELDPILSVPRPASFADGSNRPTVDLWRGAERTLLAATPALSVDEIVAQRDFLWFGDSYSGGRPDQSTAPAPPPGQDTQPVPLWRYLQRLATLRLRDAGDKALPIISEEESRCGPEAESLETSAYRSWRWLSYALPPELLLAGLDSSLSGPIEVTRVLPTTERTLADRGFAEMHLHRGAGAEFPVLWASLSQVMLNHPEFRGIFRSPGADFEEGSLWAEWLVRGFIARRILAEFLLRPCAQPRGEDPQIESSPFEYFLERLLTTRYLRDEPATAAIVFNVLRELQAGHLASPSPACFQSLVAIYRQMALDQRSVASATPQDPWPLDAIFPVLGRLRPDANPELTLLRCGLQYIENRAAAGLRKDGPFERLFWQVVRLRALFYRHLTQRPLTPGLQWFVRHYERISPARSGLSREFLAEMGMRTSGYGHGLVSWEGRICPPETQDALLEELRACARVAGRLPELEVGLVVHYPKLREGGAMEGRSNAHWMFTTADPAGHRWEEQWVDWNPFGYRYSTYYRTWRKGTGILVEMIHRDPRILRLIRGLDVCTDEMSVGNWVLAPLIRRVKVESNAAIARWHRLTGESLVPLRQTAHAGEDFVHLLTGLRQVWEAVKSFEMKRGDRIGHGVALGTEPRSWCLKAGRVAMPAETRLFDLIFVWDVLDRFKFSISGSYLHWLRNQMTQLATRVFSRRAAQRLHRQHLRELWLGLHEADTLTNCGYPDRKWSNPHGLSWPAARLLKEYLCDQECFRRGRETIWVDPADEVDVVTAIQAEVRRQLGNLGVCVEINPSSNLLIGDLGDLRAHPLWRINPPDGKGDAPPLQTVIGSDDPVTFACNLRQEYELITDAILSAGLSEQQAGEWVDQVRDAGLRFRFTEKGHPSEGYRFGNMLDPLLTRAVP